MTRIDAIFDRMDSWRHLPSYQLERRADLFFALYLPEVLNTRPQFTVRPLIIPEFPVRIGSLTKETKKEFDIPEPKSPNASYKIDYLALSDDGKTALFIELKTEFKSLNKSQENYLKDAAETGLEKLLEGIRKLFETSRSKNKYYCLLLELEQLGLVHIPRHVKEIMATPHHRGLNKAIKNIDITTRASQAHIIYILPHKPHKPQKNFDAEVILFDEFQTVVKDHPDQFSQRFAQSLQTWADVKAGEPALGIESE